MASAEVEERQLLKAMTWWDGFVVALANPGFLIAALGASIGVLGTTGAFVLWTISVCIGALQNNVYAEMATMFPHKAGGISLYAHEAWRKYFAFVGPLATFGYWFAWSSVLAISGYVIGTLAQAQWFSDHNVHPGRGELPVEPAGLHRHRLHRGRLALQRLRRAAGGLGRLCHGRHAGGPGCRARCSCPTSRATGTAAI